MEVRYIETQFLDGTLTGPRIMTSTLCTMYTSPRDLVLDVVKEIPHRYGLYILLGKTDQGGNKAYIGQTKDFQQRVRGHLANKVFWDTALVFISNADRITSSEALYLEYLGIQKAIEASTYNMDENAQVPPKPPIAVGKRIEMDQFFEEIMFFLRFYGCSIFEKSTRKKIIRNNTAVTPIKQASTQAQTRVPMPMGEDSYREYSFAIKKVGMSAKLQYFPKKKTYIISKGSMIAADNAPSLQDSIAKYRDSIFSSSKSVRQGKVYQLLEDIEIPNGSASAAAKFCAGTSRNGKTDWIDANGHTIGDFLDGVIS